MDVDCALCGARPTKRVAIRRHVGMVFMQKFYKLREPLCRKCGLSLTTNWTARTLVQGWWGFISFFFNVFVILANGLAAFLYSRLPEPTRDHLPTAEESLRRLEQLKAKGEIEESDYDRLKTDLLKLV